MIQEISSSEFEEQSLNVPLYCYGNECETKEEYAEYFAKFMEQICDYKVFKGIREHMHIFKYGSEFYEDRDHWFIRMSAYKFLIFMEETRELPKGATASYISNEAIRLLTKHLKRDY